MPNRSIHEWHTQLELLRMTSKTMARSVAPLWAATAFVAYLGWQSQAGPWALLVCALALGIGAGRWRIARRYGAAAPLDEAGLARATRQVEANTACTGLMWITATLAIYPGLEVGDRAFYAAMTCGSLGVAAFFMPLVGRSFTILTLAQMASLVGVSLFDPDCRSLPMAVMGTVYAFAMHAGANEHSRITARSILRGLEVEATNAALQVAMSAAAAANEAKTTFLANMSHEIRTPLTAVIGFSEDLLDVDQTLHQRVEAVQTINRAGKHLLNVINGILDLSKIEADRLDVEHVPVPLLQLLDEVVALARLQASEKGLDFRVEPVFPLPHTVHADPLRLRQILLNLVGNAIKFTDRGSVVVGARHDAATGRLVIAVRDTGIGIDAAQRARLFQPFGQADASISRRFGGTGLGLALSRRLAELMGGSLEVQSSAGVGSTFSLALPLSAADTLLDGPPVDAAPNDPAPADDDTARVAGPVLLAEDPADHQRLSGRQVKRLGATLALADNGEQAVAAALAQRFDLVLMDMQMPVMDGLSAVRTLRAGGYTGTIVALTANATRDDMQACLDAGCDDFLTKPVERERFEAALRRHLPAAAGQRPAAAPPAALLDGAAPGDAAYAGRLGQLRPALGALASRARSAADAADPVAAKQVGRELSSLGRQLGCEPALLLGGQFEFAGAAKDLRTVRRLLGRLNALVERVDTGLRGATAADDGPIFSALLTQGPDMADLVAYFLTKLPDYLERMRSAVAALDFGRIARCAHDLKSVGGGYGYPMLRELALAVEKAAKAQDAPAVAELLQRFETLTRRIVAAGGPARTGASQRLPEPTSEPALP